MMAMVSNWTKLNIYGVFMMSVISVLLCRTVNSSCQQGEVFDPNIKKCVDCTQICEFAPEDTLCSDCRKDGNAHTDWAYLGGNEQRLYGKLFSDYNMKVRPVWNSSDPVNVSLQIAVNQIVEMDEREQILTTNLWIEQHWTDQKLVWDEDDFDGIEEMRIPASEIWVPDVTLYDNADSNDYVAHSRSSNAIVSSKGNVDLWSKPTLVKSTCKINVKYFPFDMQECTMKFGSWTYTSFQMNLSKFANDPDLSELVPNEQWDLKYATTRRHSQKYTCCPEEYLDVTFYFGLKRKPLYYIYNLLMPCMLLSALSLLGFFMPYDVGVVKVSLSITLILSLTVFLLLVAEMMPRTSEDVPLIGQYYAATMFMISISTAMNVFVLNINEKGGLVHSREVPRWLRTIALDYLAVIFWVVPCPCNRLKKKGRGTHHEHHELRYKPVKNQNTHIVTFDTTSPRNGGGTSNHVVDNRGSRYMNGPAPQYFDTARGDQHEHDSETVSERRLARMEKITGEILKHMKALERKKEKATQLKKDWALVAKVLDRLLLIIFLFSTVATTISLLSQRPEDKVPPPLDS
ncbi:neuronal acetylcholine receptor subunit alpha-10-like isoform X3 [Apostichopus japonicus]|uniref:neuronal acetylcholine receptor subunit alpha-10-like isoform X3 n=1 Tax=Stichopus japonicus TaxID=307972 RepID=UPI003AB62F08